jgi:hypothetical protein
VQSAAFDEPAARSSACGRRVYRDLLLDETRDAAVDPAEAEDCARAGPARRARDDLCT